MVVNSVFALYYIIIIIDIFFVIIVFKTINWVFNKYYLYLDIIVYNNNNNNNVTRVYVCMTAVNAPLLPASPIQMREVLLQT